MTDDEFTVLLIASRGESMIPIGRWEQPVKNLAERGLLRMLDAANFVITDEGCKACQERDKQDDQVFAQIIQTGSKLGVAQSQLRSQAERMAATLAEMARVSAQVTGDAPDYAARKWSEIVFKRAVEMLKELA